VRPLFNFSLETVAHQGAGAIAAVAAAIQQDIRSRLERARCRLPGVQFRNAPLRRALRSSPRLWADAGHTQQRLAIRPVDFTARPEVVLRQRAWDRHPAQVAGPLKGKSSHSIIIAQQKAGLIKPEFPQRRSRLRSANGYPLPG